MNIPSLLNDQPFMVKVPPANRQTNVPGKYKVEMNYQFDPSRRLRFYQFDPLHHDEAVFSIH